MKIFNKNNKMIMTMNKKWQQSKFKNFIKTNKNNYS